MDKRERFLKELHELLAKYGAEINADLVPSYDGQDVVTMIVSFYGGRLSDEIDLGSFVDQIGHG